MRSLPGLLAIFMLAACAPVGTEQVELEGSGWTGTDSSREKPPPPEAEPRDPQAEQKRAMVRSVLTAYYRDYRRRDWGAMVTHFWPDAQVVSVSPTPTGDRVGAMSAAEWVAEARDTFAGMQIFSITMGDTVINVEGDLAQVWVRHYVTFGEGDNVVRGSDLESFTLLRIGNRWRIATLSFAP